MIRVLLADDQRINRVLLARCLDPARYEVTEAEDGRQAFELFKQSDFDVVLLDVMMPEMDGFETARAIKAHLGHDHVPIIMVTALTDEESLRQGMDAGADDFISKPFNRVVLESKMKAALRTRSVFRTIADQKKELQALHEQSHGEQVMAEKLMAELLSSRLLSSPMFKFRSVPMDVFNGDLLMAGLGPNGRTRVMLGDFAGHGLAAAIGGLPMVMGFDRMCRQASSIFEIAQEANRRLRTVLPRDRFLAATFLDIDPLLRQVEVINAGMPPVLVRGANGEIRATVGSQYLPLSILEEFDNPEEVIKIRLEPGDRFYLYSDGIIEALSPGGEDFGAERLAKALGGAESDRSFEHTLEVFDAFVSTAPASDDVTLLEVWPEASVTTADVEPDGNVARTGKVSLHLTPDMIRHADILQLVQSTLESFGPLEGHRADVFAVVAELLNNAIDHGVLGLESSMKQSIEGFARFYEERAERIEKLNDGFVDVQLGLDRSESGWRLRIYLEDSGEGFDFDARAEAEPQPESEDALFAHGRGMSLIGGLCDSVKYFPPGNRVEAIYSWTPSESTVEP